MNLDTLKLFLDISNMKSISKAAANAHITQSALSQQLKTWEASLGTELLQRSNKGTKLTESGEIAHKYASQICKLYDDMLTELEQLQRTSYQLSIYAISEVCNYALPCTLFEIKGNFPYCDFSLNEATTPHIEEHIMLEEAAIGFISGPASKEELYSQKVFTDQLLLVTGNTQDELNEIELDELAQYPLISSSQLACVHRALQAKSKDIKLNTVYNLDSIEAIKLAVVRGHGVAFLPYMSIKKELYNKQLRSIPIRNFHIDHDIYMIKKPNHKCSYEIKQLISYIEQTLIDTLC